MTKDEAVAEIGERLAERVFHERGDRAVILLTKQALRDGLIEAAMEGSRLDTKDFKKDGETP